MFALLTPRYFSPVRFCSKNLPIFAAIIDYICGNIAASFDPTFWPLHGQIERLLSFKRIRAERGATKFDESWGYTTGDGALYLQGICDWSAVEDEEDLDTLPTCKFGDGGSIAMQIFDITFLVSRFALTFCCQVFSLCLLSIVLAISVSRITTSPLCSKINFQKNPLKNPLLFLFITFSLYMYRCYLLRAQRVRCVGLREFPR